MGERRPASPPQGPGEGPGEGGQPSRGVGKTTPISPVSPLEERSGAPFQGLVRCRVPSLRMVNPGNALHNFCFHCPMPIAR